MRTLFSAIALSAFSLSLAFVASAAMADTGFPSETLPSGVVIQKIITKNGPHPSATNVVTVNYRGALQNGTEFDSSYARHAPAKFPLNRVIPCWTDGVQKMSVGETARLTCPAATAYGLGGVPGKIPPNSVLTFEVELLSIEN